MGYKWRVHFMESERGWGQDWWTMDYDTHEEAQKAHDDCNARNTSPVAPDYYIQAQSVERVWVDEPSNTGHDENYEGKHRATEAVNETFNR